MCHPTLENLNDPEGNRTLSKFCSADKKSVATKNCCHMWGVYVCNY
jgi:hypothetical protein